MKGENAISDGNVLKGGKLFLQEAEVGGFYITKKKVNTEEGKKRNERKGARGESRRRT